MSINTSNTLSLNDLASFQSSMMPGVLLERSQQGFQIPMLSNSSMAMPTPQPEPSLSRSEKIEQIRFLAPRRHVKRPNVPSKIILNMKVSNKAMF